MKLFNSSGHEVWSDSFSRFWKLYQEHGYFIYLTYCHKICVRSNYPVPPDLTKAMQMHFDLLHKSKDRKDAQRALGVGVIERFSVGSKEKIYEDQLTSAVDLANREDIQNLIESLNVLSGFKTKKEMFVAASKLSGKPVESIKTFYYRRYKTRNK